MPRARIRRRTGRARPRGWRPQPWSRGGTPGGAGMLACGRALAVLRLSERPGGAPACFARVEGTPRQRARAHGGRRPRSRALACSSGSATRRTSMCVASVTTLSPSTSVTSTMGPDAGMRSLGVVRWGGVGQFRRAGRCVGTRAYASLGFTGGGSEGWAGSGEPGRGTRPPPLCWRDAAFTSVLDASPRMGSLCPQNARVEADKQRRARNGGKTKPQQRPHQSP